jgi:GGDEF domain-containing protein
MTETRPMPAFLIEDCLALLRILVCAAWFGVALLLGVETWIRVMQPQDWPALGFGLTYHGLALEFTLNTIVLTTLLVRRDWYERVPRQSLPRVRWLLAAVLIWIALHSFMAFHVTGSVHGPLLPLLPVLLAAALLALPERGGLWLAAFLLAGHGGMIALETMHALPPRGALADVFSYAGPATVLGVTALVLVMLAAMTVALLAHLRFRQSGVALHHAGRIDPTTGLFHKAFLTDRVAQEIARVRRQGDCAVLMLIRLERLADDDATDARLHAMADALLGLIRIGSDTAGRYGIGTLAVLLPASKAAGAAVVAERLRAGLARFDTRFGAGLIEGPAAVTTAQVYAAAERALAQPAQSTSVVKVLPVA